MQAARRTLSLALGRGAMYLGTYDALPTEMLESPDIDLSGRIVERNDAIVTLDLTADQPASGGGALSERTAWPEFQNGAVRSLDWICDRRSTAARVRSLAHPLTHSRSLAREYPQASALRINKNISDLSRTWIVYNKPKAPSYDHAGFLFGLGLTGQLACLTVTDLYRYLSHEHDATLVGVLLGMSASKRCVFGDDDDDLDDDDDDGVGWGGGCAQRPGGVDGERCNPSTPSPSIILPGLSWKNAVSERWTWS